MEFKTEKEFWQIPAVEVTIPYSNKAKGSDYENYDRVPKLKRLHLKTPYLEKKRIIPHYAIRSQV